MGARAVEPRTGAEAALSYLGFGVTPPTSSWGRMLSDASQRLDLQFLVYVPGIALALTIAAFTVTAADPERLRAQAESMSNLTLGRSVDTLSKALADIREGDEPRMTVELALLRS